MDPFAAIAAENPDDLVPVRIGEYRGWINRSYDTPGFYRVLETFLSDGLQNKTAFNESEDRKVFRTPFGNGDIYIKQYDITNLKQFVKTLFRVNKAQKSWQYGRFLTRKGIHTPFPIAYIHRGRGLFPPEHLLITAGIPNSVTLRRYVDQQVQTARMPAGQKRQLMKNLAELLGKLHLAGIYHGDFTAHNIIAEILDAPEYVRIHLTDLDAIDSRLWISSRRRIKNLDEIGRNFLDLRMFSTTDRARFLKYYLGIYTRETRSFKRLFTEVLARTRFRLNKYGKDFIRD